MKASRIAAAARDIRTSLDLSQTSMAALLGITNTHLSAIEAGQRMPSIRTLARFWTCFQRDPYIMAHEAYLKEVGGSKKGKAPR